MHLLNALPSHLRSPCVGMVCLAALQSQAFGQYPDRYWECMQRGLDGCRAQRESPLLREYPRIAVRKANALVISLKKGGTAVFRDVVAETPDYIAYWLDEVNERADYVVLGVDGYEYRGSIVVSRGTGWRKEFDFSLPVFSDDAQFLAFTIPGGTAFWNPRVEVYAVQPDSLVAELSLTPTEVGFSLLARGDTLWTPGEPRWQGHSLHFRTEETTVEARRSRDVDKWYWPGDSLAVEKNAGRWQLRRLR